MKRTQQSVVLSDPSEMLTSQVTFFTLGPCALCVNALLATKYNKSIKRTLLSICLPSWSIRQATPRCMNPSPVLPFSFSLGCSSPQSRQQNECPHPHDQPLVLLLMCVIIGLIIRSAFKWVLKSLVSERAADLIANPQCRNSESAYNRMACTDTCAPGAAAAHIHTITLINRHNFCSSGSAATRHRGGCERHKTQETGNRREGWEARTNTDEIISPWLLLWPRNKNQRCCVRSNHWQNFANLIL